jgi:hypothetical protein
VDSLLTITEINERFTDEWVLVEEPQTDQNLAVVAGRVRWHSPDRDEVYRKANELKPKRFAVVFTGKLPQDVAVIL